MTNPREVKRRWYAISSYCLLILATLYLGLVNALVRYELAPEGELAWLTGRPRVVVSGDILKMYFKNTVQQVVLSFNQPLAGQIFLNRAVSTPQYEVTWDPETRHSIVVKAASPAPNRPPEGFTGAVFSVGRLFATADFTEREIVNVKVDGRSMSPYDFLNQILIRDKSSVLLYYPMALENISRESARAFGNHIVYGTLIVLLLLSITQILLLFATLRSQPNSVTHYFSNRAANPAITVVDSIANEYAIPLGLLGTITAIWVALEQPSINFMSFNEILNTLRLAVFTTVLGLVTKVVCMLRGRIGIAGGENEQP